MLLRLWHGSAGRVDQPGLRSRASIGCDRNAGSDNGGHRWHQPAPPTAKVFDDDGTEVPAIKLIQPRNLSPEYARRVTAAWQATKSPFQNPQETFNSSSGKAGDPDNL